LIRGARISRNLSFSCCIYGLWLIDSAAANQVTGPIPEEFGHLSRMTELYLSENQLTGTVPESVLNLSWMKKMYLHDNLLTGNFDQSLCDPKSPFQFRSESSFYDVGGDCSTTYEVICACCSFCCDPDVCCNLADSQTGKRICSPRSKEN
jgi:hypothetical protein